MFYICLIDVKISLKMIQGRLKYVGVLMDHIDKYLILTHGAFVGITWQNQIIPTA